MTRDQPARITLTSPVLTLLGGVDAQGMVCDVDGVCGPVGSSDVESSPSDVVSSSTESAKQ